MTKISNKLINKSLINLDNLIRRILKYVPSLYLSEDNELSIIRIFKALRDLVYLIMIHLLFNTDIILNILYNKNIKLYIYISITNAVKEYKEIYGTL